jgi:hypothetical protein
MKLLRLAASTAFAVTELAVPSWGQSDSALQATGNFREGQGTPPCQRERDTIDGHQTINRASLAGREAIVLRFASW